MDIDVHIRWMIRRDMPEVLAIENDSFEEPWHEEDYIQILRRRNCIGMVAEVEDKIVGFMVYELHKSKLNLMNFAVDAEYRRLGVGSRMIRKLKDKLSAERRNRIEFLVRETNLRGHLFLQKNGFRATEIKYGYYETWERIREDAYKMTYKYVPEYVPQREVIQFAR